MTRACVTRLGLPLWVLLLSALGCSSGDKALTQIELTVDSDLKVPDEIDHLSIAVSGMVTDAPAVADLLDRELPRHLTLLHEGGPLGPVVVTASALHGETKVVERVVQLKFTAGETKHVAIDLQRACVDVSCPSGSSCEDGECKDIAKGEPVPVEDGGADAGEDGGTDAGASDAGSADAGAMDAGDDAGAMDAGDDAGADAAQDAGDAGPIVNQPPDCAISEPADNDAKTAGLAIRFAGSCTDPESGRRLTSGLRWSSDLDGALGSGSTVSVALTSAGAHAISLCAADPVDSALTGCATITVNVSLPDPPTASIDSVTQANDSSSPFSTSPGITLMGSSTGQMVTVAWRDTFIGQFSTTQNATLMTPQVGRHLVTLTVTDNVGQRAIASKEFVVLANSASQLVDAYTLVNTTLATAGSARVDALAADSADHGLVATTVVGTPTLYRFDATKTNASPSLVLTSPNLPDSVRAIALAGGDDLAYFATGSGLAVCSYAANSGFSGSCTSFGNGDFASNDMQAVTRARADGDDYLVVGAALGMLATTTVAGSSSGNAALDNRDVRGLAASGGVVWVATHDHGLYKYDLKDDQTHGVSGGPSDQLTAVSVDRLGMVWVGSEEGVGRYDDAHDSWLTLRSDQSPEPGLPSDTIRCLASTQVMIGGMIHDVIWVGTDMGVTRIDAISASLMNLTAADGLPSASVRAIVILSDGTKLIGTDSGLARYTGP